MSALAARCLSHKRNKLRAEVLAKLPAVEGPAPHTPEWHALRVYDPDRPTPVVFGATEAAGAMGLSPYANNTPLGLFLKKRGLDDDKIDSAAMRRGRRFERPVLEEYAYEMQAPVIVGMGFYQHPQNPFMGCTPDGLVVAENLRGVDSKCSSFRRYDAFGLDTSKFGEEGTDQLPIDYVCQGQQTMAVLGLREIDFVVLFDIHNIKVYRVERNDDLIEAIVKSEQELAERIINNDPPEPTWSLPDSSRLIRLWHGMEPGKWIELSPEGVDRWNRLTEVKEQIKSLETAKSEIEQQLQWEIKDAQCARLPGG